MPEKENQSLPPEKMTRYVQRRQFVAYSILIVLFLLDGVALPLCVYFRADVLLYVFAALSALMAAGAFFAFFYVSHNFGKEADLAIGVILDQLNAFSRGSVRLEEGKYDLAIINRLQKGLNESLSTYSNYSLVYENRAADAAIQKKIDAGTVFGYQDFQDYLFREIQNGKSYRSALLFIKATGSDKIPSETLDELKNQIISSFSHPLIGTYDDSTFAVYLFHVESFITLETKCQDFVSRFNQLILNQIGDLGAVYGCRIGGAVLPYVPYSSLIKAALKALGETETFKIDEGTRNVSYTPSVRSEGNRRSALLLSFESYQEQFYEAKTFLTQVDVMRSFCRFFALSAGYEQGGALLYTPKLASYRVVVEGDKDEGKCSFRGLKETIAAADMDPFYDLAKADLSFSCSNLDDLPTPLSAYMKRLGIASFFLSPICFRGEKIGLVYLTSSSPRGSMNLISREYFSMYAAEVSAFALSTRDEFLAQGSASLLEDLASRTGKYVYSIDRGSHRLSYLSNNLKLAFPEAKVGDLCYEAFRFSSGSPCPHCPLVEGNDRRVIEAIAPEECRLSVLQLRGSPEEESSLLIEKAVHEDDSLSGANCKLVDSLLLVKNSQALSLAVAKHLKLGGMGYVLSLRLLNSQEILGTEEPEGVNLLMSTLTKTFVSAGLDDILYRYGEKELSFLLKNYSKSKLIDFVEEAAELLNGTIEFQNKPFTPEIAFSAISYPIDAKSAHELMSLVPSELNRSAALGPGYLMEVAKKNPRKALRSSYVLDLLSSSLDKDQMAVNIQPVYDNETRKVVGADLLARLYDENGQPVAPNEFIPLARANNLVSKIDLSSIRAAGALYENYGFSLFKTVGIKNLNVHISPESILSPEFPLLAKNIFARYKFPKEYLVLQIESSFLTLYSEQVEKLIAALAPLGAIFQAVNFDPATMNFETLSKFKITRLGSARHLVSDATTTQNDYTSFTRFLNQAELAHFTVSANGVETAEESEMMTHLLQASLVSGFYFCKPLNETDFIKLLNYGN